VGGGGEWDMHRARGIIRVLARNVCGGGVYFYIQYVCCYHITVCVFVFVCVDIREERCWERRKEER